MGKFIKTVEYSAAILSYPLSAERYPLSKVIEVFRLAVITVVTCRILQLRGDFDALNILSFFAAAVNGNQDCIHFHIAACYFKRDRHLGSK